ncbi:MAG: hypothetical protein MUD08_17790 [Cytophagales bacterium]|jgi:hypothetical protein|nr:hypothetical protein [Cytophagales bacterium]
MHRALQSFFVVVFWAKIAQNEIVKAALATMRFGQKLPKTLFEIRKRKFGEAGPELSILTAHA